MGASRSFIGILRALSVMVLIMKKGLVAEDSPFCNRTPLRATSAPLEPDNRFELTIEELDPETQKYNPNRVYPIRLASLDGKTTFIAFTIWVQEDTRYNEKNPRRPYPLSPGRLEPVYDNPDVEEAQLMKDCNNTVMQTDTKPKTSVRVRWRAPDKNNKCVTIQAYVAIKQDVWYTSTGPLAKKVCEDKRLDEDLKPTENYRCTACEEARYQLKFEGTWSYNTHLQLYPQLQASFSDIVGASHNKNFNVYQLSDFASDGLKMLAEQGNTTKLEMEILDELGTNVRTVIKATAPPSTNMSTVASFRVNRDKHQISLVTSLMPSPDWFLGVNNLELCNAKDNTWTKDVVLNLYPLDAGTDSGKTFESSNDETKPPQPISHAKISSEVLKTEMKPFAKLRVHLVRTYPKPECANQAPDSTKAPRVEEGNEEEEPRRPYLTPAPPTYTYETRTARPSAPSEEPNEGESCTGHWELLECEAPCINGTRRGLASNIFHYDLKTGRGRANEDDTIPPKGCSMVEAQVEECEEPCEEEEKEPDENLELETAERRVGLVWPPSLPKPGQSWNFTSNRI